MLVSITPIIFLIFVLLLIFLAVKVVPQSKVLVIERFGKYTRTLHPGLSIIIPFLDRVAHRVSILERRLPDLLISVITRDNVEVQLNTSVFFRVVDASRSVYRIREIDGAIHTAASSIVRSAAGKLELDELQSSRDSMNQEIATKLSSAAEIWGVEVTRTEITDVLIDDRTKDAQRQQLNAERERRATIARAEGERSAVELAADARLYEAEKEADAIRIEADAAAYAIRAKAEAEADQTTLLGKAIAGDGQAAVNFEILKRQVDAMGALASADNSKTIILPSEVTKTLGGLTALAETFMPSNPKPPSKPTPKTSLKTPSKTK